VEPGRPWPAAEQLVLNVPESECLATEEGAGAVPCARAPVLLRRSSIPVLGERRVCAGSAQMSRRCHIQSKRQLRKEVGLAPLIWELSRSPEPSWREPRHRLAEAWSPRSRSPAVPVPRRGAHRQHQPAGSQRVVSPSYLGRAAAAGPRGAPDPRFRLSLSRLNHIPRCRYRGSGGGKGTARSRQLAAVRVSRPPRSAPGGVHTPPHQPLRPRGDAGPEVRPLPGRTGRGG
jgi:hypothetical protein